MGCTVLWSLFHRNRQRNMTSWSPRRKSHTRRPLSSFYYSSLENDRSSQNMKQFRQESIPTVLNTSWTASVFKTASFSSARTHLQKTTTEFKVMLENSWTNDHDWPKACPFGRLIELQESEVQILRRFACSRITSVGDSSLMTSVPIGTSHVSNSIIQYWGVRTWPREERMANGGSFDLCGRFKAVLSSCLSKMESNYIKPCYFLGLEVWWFWHRHRDMNRLTTRSAFTFPNFSLNSKGEILPK